MSSTSKNKVIIDLEVNAPDSKSLNKFQKGLQAVGNVGKKAFKGIGTAIKGAGIGLLIGVFASLWEALKKNQKIMDTVNTVINAMGVLIKPVVDGVSSLVEKFGANNTLMKSMGTIVSNLIKVALTPLKITFNTLKLAMQEMALGWAKVQSAFGKGDEGAVAKLKDEVQETKDKIKELAVESVDAVKTIIEEGPKAFKGVSEIIKTTVGEISKGYEDISIRSALATGKAINQAAKDIERLNILQQTTALIALKEAEDLRQIRDDTSRTFEDRIKANNELKAILEKQRIDELKIVNDKIAAQQLLLAIDGENEEAKNALLLLNNELLEVEERINGQISEQKTNAVGLVDEQAALAEEQIEIAQKLSDEKAAIENEARDKKAEKDKEIEDQKVANAYLVADQLISIDENATQFAKNLLANKLKSGKISEEQYDKQLAEIEKKAANRKKAYAISDTIINTASAIIGIWKDFPKVDFGITAGIMSGVVGVLGATQVAKIASTPTDFATGGIVSGNSYTGDNISANLNSGEMVLNQQQQAKLYDQANGSSGSSSLNADMIAQVVINAIKQIPVVITEQSITDKQKEVEIRESGFSY